VAESRLAFVGQSPHGGKIPGLHAVRRLNGERRIAYRCLKIETVSIATKGQDKLTFPS
jgi:hypothetical protein